MVGNTTTGTTEVDVRGERVTFDGMELTAEPVDAVSLSRLYFLCLRQAARHRLGDVGGGIAATSEHQRHADRWQPASGANISVDTEAISGRRAERTDEKT